MDSIHRVDTTLGPAPDGEILARLNLGSDVMVEGRSEGLSSCSGKCVVGKQPEIS